MTADYDGPILMEPHFQRYLDWYSLRDVRDSDKPKGPPEATRKLIQKLEWLIVSPEGRLKIANALVGPSQTKLERLRGNPSQKRIKWFVLELESFISILPDDERFSPAVMTLRKIIPELCSMLERYGVVGATSDEYQGPRPTRFERLLGTPEEPPSEPESDNIIEAAL